MWRRASYSFETLAPWLSRSRSICSLRHRPVGEILIRPFSTDKKASSVKKAEDVMPIGMGLEREELEAELQSLSRLLISCLRVIFSTRISLSRIWFSCFYSTAGFFCLYYVVDSVNKLMNRPRDLKASIQGKFQIFIAGSVLPFRSMTTLAHPEPSWIEGSSPTSLDISQPQRIKFKRLDKTAKHIMNANSG